MIIERIIALVLFCIGLALYNSAPFLSGVFTIVSLIVLAGIEDDDDDDHYKPA